MAWEAVSALVAAFSALLGVLVFGLKQARIRGAHEERMEAMRKQLSDHDIIIVEHTAQLAAQEGSFKVIAATLGFIKDMVEKMSAKLDRHCEEKP